jgi:hypothetical protein
LVAAAVIAWRRAPTAAPPGTRARGLFPAWLVRHASMHADIGYFAFNVFVYGLIFGWAVMSYKFLSGLVSDSSPQLRRGRADVIRVHGAVDHHARALPRVRFGYWLDHYLKHRVPALWELHKVHIGQRADPAHRVPHPSARRGDLRQHPRVSLG